MRRLLRPRALRRLATSLLAGATIALQLSGTVHLAFAKHSLCAEHGVATDTHDQGQASNAARPAQELPASPAVSSGEGPRPGRHDHCPLAAEHRERATLVAAAHAVPWTLPSAHAIAPVTATVSRSPSELRLLAPKTSPPA